MNDLIDRYLAAIARELPERDRADIIAELRDELLTKVEIREEAMGRPLDERELGAELVAFGNPLIVAGRYRKVQHLIGPQMFPFWWAAMRATLVVIGAVYLVLLILAVIFGGGRLSGLDVPDLVPTLVFAFGGVTGACALIERYGKPEKIARWRPERLPPPHGRHASRFELLTELGMGIVFLLWWTGAIQFRNFVPDWGVRLELAPVWAKWFWWIVGYSIIEIGSNVTALVRPDRVVLVRWVVIWRSLLGAGILIGVIQADRFLVVSGPTSVAQYVLDNWMRFGIAVAIAVFLARAGVEAWRLRQVSDAAPSAA